MTLEQIVESIKKALEKVVVSEDLPVYKASIDDTYKQMNLMYLILIQKMKFKKQ